VNVVLLGTYDLGRQPFGLASPAAFLRRAGHDVHAIDLSRDKLSEAAVRDAAVIAFYLPMHTATRLAMPVIERVRAINPAATLVAYGLYAPLNEALLRKRGVTIVLGPEAEVDLVSVAGGTSTFALRATADKTIPSCRESIPSAPEGRHDRAAVLPKLRFIQPDRAGLPALNRYPSLQMPDGTSKIVGATDATRGCKHRCRHCPIVPVYGGQFRVVPVDVVMADVRAQVAQGATHISFGDPDFFNGPTHARRIVEALHRECPQVTYDVTIKIAHLLTHRQLLPVLASTRCAFVTSAVESVDDEVLAKLEKGHTRADFRAAAQWCREAGLTLVPTFVAFTPWTTLAGFADLLKVVADLDLVSHVAPIQWGIRLLVTWDSRLLELPDIRSAVGAFDSATLTFPWRHHDPRVDALQQDVMMLIGRRPDRSRWEIFDAVCHLASVHPRPPAPPRPRTLIPYLNEPWYC
jgi:radical SAM superfamily enzyme YgiQ (UPF0313 family)